jgi:hypothetical protein
MTLIAPGVEIDVIDYSTGPISAPGTIPLIVVASAANKTAANSTTIAAGTIPANANELTLLTSQSDLLTMFGIPTFYQTSSNTPLNAYELNEYGLQTAYSVLGITNSAYVLRANIDLSQLVGTTVRPTGAPANQSYWLNTSITSFGIFVWNATTQSFSQVTPAVITSSSYVSLPSGVPLSSYGTIGSYVAVAVEDNSPIYIYYKTAANTWVNLGSSSWQAAIPTVTGTVVNPSGLTSGNTILINGTTVTLSGTTGSALVTSINSADITGVTAAIVNGAVTLYATSAAASGAGTITIANGTGTLLTGIGITAGVYNCPIFVYQSYANVPEWLTGDATPRPTGSIWVKMGSSSTGSVAGSINFSMSQYNSTTSTFASVAVSQAVTTDTNTNGANAAIDNILDPVGGGVNIAQYTVYVACVSDTSQDTGYIGFMPYYRTVAGATTITGAPSTNNPTLVTGNSFTMQVTEPGSSNLSSAYTVTLTGTTTTALATDILALNIPNITASVNAFGNIVITHSAGGDIVFTPVTGNVLVTAGITAAAYVYQYPLYTNGSGVVYGSSYIATYWTPLPYTPSPTAPVEYPAQGTYWYYSDPTAVDIMINSGTAWVGYRTLTLDARGYNLTNTDPNGVQVVATAPTTQSTGAALVNGDLWINTSDLDHYPLLYRYQSGQWVAINLEDTTDINGILFADARWDTSGTTDPITGILPPLSEFLESSYLDLDAPQANLYPRGMLLFNTRRSGYNVKSFQPNYFNSQSFSGELPEVTSTWVTAIGNRTNGSPYMGRKAVRALVVAAMNSAVETNQDIRSQQYFYNLISAPGYTELAPQLVSLNQDNGYTAFVVSECPMRLEPVGTEIIAWSTGGTGESFQDEVLGVSDPYLAAWYSCGQTTDLNGNAIIMPPSYMALQGIIYNDSVSYEWFAPAGLNRGVVTNASAIGYVDYLTGDFVTNAVNTGLQGTLYSNQINPIVLFPNSGIILWGNETRNPTGTSSALGSINIARLICYLRYELNILSRPFLFQPNDQITRNQISTITGQLMNTLISQRAITDYLVVCDTSNNTPDTIAARELFMDVAIIPITAVEFIYIPLIIDQPGTSAATLT